MELCQQYTTERLLQSREIYRRLLERRSSTDLYGKLNHCFVLVFCCLEENSFAVISSNFRQFPLEIGEIIQKKT